jgi:glycosyltransferase involved in cell wall biosynthesis
VFVPCYNYGRYLEQNVNSILTQEGVDVRVLILDDASKDNSGEVGAELARRDPRVEYRRHRQNIGHIATYNEAIEWVAGDFTLLLSADDWLVPGALARAAAVFDAHPDVVLTCGKAMVADANGPLSPIPDQSRDVACRVESGPDFIARSCRHSTTALLWTPTAIGRTSVQKLVGGYDPELPHSGDLEMWLRFACHGSIAVVSAFQAFYRKHDRNMHYSCTARLANTRQHLAAFQAAFRRFGHRLSNVPALEQLYARSFADDALQHAGAAFEDNDLAGYAEYLDFAAAVYPAIRRTAAWRRLQLKQWLGPAVVRYVRRPIDFARGMAARTPAS